MCRFLMAAHPVDLDRLPFYGLKAPPELKYLKKHLQTFETSKLVSLVKDFCNGSDPVKILAKISSEDIDRVALAQILAGLYQMYLLAIRQPKVVFKPEHFRRDLEDIGISSEHVAILAEAFNNATMRRKIESIYSLTPSLPTITAVNWRVDISISSPEQPKLLAPIVTLLISLSNQQTYSIQLDVKSFHKLRFSIAQMLHEMQLLEKRPVLKPFIAP